MMKIWKGIYYAYWMSDKSNVQRELALNIAKILHTFNHYDRSIIYYKCFFATMNREWSGIDHHRIDKYYSLIRIMQRQMFVYLSSCSWDSSCLEAYLSVFEKEVLTVSLWLYELS